MRSPLPFPCPMPCPPNRPVVPKSCSCRGGDRVLLPLWVVCFLSFFLSCFLYHRWHRLKRTPLRRLPAAYINNRKRTACTRSQICTRRVGPSRTQETAEQRPRKHYEPKKCRIIDHPSCWLHDGQPGAMTAARRASSSSVRLPAAVTSTAPARGG